MRSLAIRFVLLIGFGVALVACGANANSSPPASSDVNVSLTTRPDPPEGGDVELVATVTNAQGQPINDAEVFIFATHTEMTGMDMEGQAVAQGEGRYATTANFSMSGAWRVTVQVNYGGQNTVEEFDLRVR